MNTFRRAIFRKKWLFILLIIVIAASWKYYQYRAEQNAPPPYLTAAVTRGDIESSVLASGSLEAAKQVDVGAQVSGEISTLSVAIGDVVKAGDLIAEIDASSQINSRNTAQAQLQSQEAGLQSAQAALNEAQQAYDRQRALLRRGAVAKEAVEKANAALQSAKASVEQAKAAVETSRIELNNAGLNLGHTSVTAPIDGTVIAVLVGQGQTVNAVQDVPTLVKIAQTDTMVVKPEIAEADISKVRAGMPAYFSLIGNPARRFDSTLKSIDPAPLSVSNNSKSSDGAVYYYGKMDAANPDNLLRIGMTANVTIITAQAHDVLLVPLTAITPNEQGQDSVQVLVNGEPQSRQVTIGIEDGVNAQVLDGLTEGEEVIISQGSGTTPDQYGGF
ncbi:efflux RND transporter periplasmic adaptor subunit [Cardiobacteriaceae bacterium TAE3-ERU3]|nr:efflux RND transporter periplasmic adaptor subunit [Cardiobacteriaceae bacterium TAE3-ERU3]